MKKPPRRARTRAVTPTLSTELTLGITAALDKKAQDLIVLDLRKASAFTDVFVICTGTNVRQVHAIPTPFSRRSRRIRIHSPHSPLPA